METKNLDDIKPNPKNPRRMSKQDGQALKKSMMEFGDLSCVVFNVQTQQMVGGHQRLEIMKSLPAERRVTLNEEAGKGIYETSEFMDDVGTTAIGYIWIGNKQFAYREVNWPYEKEIAANVAANRIQGEFDLELLAEHNQFLEDQAPDMLEMTGQTPTELKHLKKRFGPDEPEPENQEPKNDDGSRPFEFRVSESQLSRILAAIGEMKLERQLTMETNKDLDGDAIYYICEAYLGSKAAAPDENTTETPVA
jgi:hypothetical protein